MTVVLENDSSLLEPYELELDVESEPPGFADALPVFSLNVKGSLPFSGEEALKTSQFIATQSARQSPHRRSDFRSLNPLEQFAAWPAEAKGCLMLQSHNMGCTFLIVKSKVQGSVFKNSNPQFVLFRSDRSQRHVAIEKCCVSLEATLSCMTDLYEKAADLHYY